LKENPLLADLFKKIKCVFVSNSLFHIC